jgi:hypothetical protein
VATEQNGMHKLTVHLKGQKMPIASDPMPEEEADRQLAAIAAAQRRGPRGVAQLPWATFRGEDVISAQKVRVAEPTRARILA